MLQKLTSGIFVPFLISRARASRLAGRFRDAATLYEEAISLRPGLARLHVQAGHMRKEAGDFRRAEAHYQSALRILPDDADLALQLGHFHKIRGHVAEAEAEYARSAGLDPGGSAAKDELNGLRDSDWYRRAGLEVPAEMLEGAGTEAADLQARGAELIDAGVIDRLAPDLGDRKSVV